MAKDGNQKLKLLYLLNILREHTDEEHHLTMRELIDRLEGYGISAERKSIYADLEALRTFGVDVIAQKPGYYIGARDFELPELKLLVDSVQASKFITEKKSAALIRKLEGLTSRYHARQLHRQVYVSERVKALNETIYYVVDQLHDSINRGRKIAFQYFEYTVDKQRRLRNGGAEYVVSPYSLTVSDDNYYLISHYPKYAGLTHFRVDRMQNVRMLDEAAEEVAAIAGSNFHLGEYSKGLFSMYAGQTQKVRMKCHRSLINAVIDRFGEEVFVRPDGADWFVVTTDVTVSPTFFSWVFLFGENIRILEPTEVAGQFRDMLQRAGAQYNAR